MKNTTLSRLSDGTVKIEIPKLSREYIKKVTDRIHYYLPEEGIIYDISGLEPIDRSFTWNLEKAISSKVDTLLEPIIQTDAYHTYGYYGIFKPSLLEVVATLPEDMIDKVRYFSLKWPQTVDELNREKEITNAGYHHSSVTWYK